MTPVILLFTVTADIHADRVLAFSRSGTRFVRLDLDRPHTWKFSFHDGEVKLVLSGTAISLGEVKSVFVRRTPNSEVFKRPLSAAVSAYSDYVAQQEFVLFSDCLSILDSCTRFVNPLASNSRLGKAVQAYHARAAGFNTPSTYIGSDPEAARQFCERIFASGGRPCVKPIVNSKVNINGEPHTQFTNTIDPSALDQLDSLSLCPTIFQQYINKAHEVRATVIGDRVFAARIDSQQAGGGTAIDWRRYNIPNTPHQAINLPVDVIDRILNVQHSLGLLYSAFDFIVTPDGDYVFLETNPYGQWLWIEDLTGLPISQAIADYLSGS
jgi:hypothetical protein